MESKLATKKLTKKAFFLPIWMDDVGKCGLVGSEIYNMNNLRSISTGHLKLPSFIPLFERD